MTTTPFEKVLSQCIQKFTLECICVKRSNCDTAGEMPVYSDGPSKMSGHLTAQLSLTSPMNRYVITFVSRDQVAEVMDVHLETIAQTKVFPP